MYVIPNNILPQWRKMFLHIYPKANLLVIDRKNFNVKKRAATLEKIVNEDYDAILIAYSCFDMLSLSKKYYMEFYKKQLATLEKAKEKFSAERKINSKQLSVIFFTVVHMINTRTHHSIIIEPKFIFILLFVCIDTKNSHRKKWEFFHLVFSLS